MKNIKGTKIAIHFASADDDFGMQLIKQTNQFPNYYHKGKKQLLNNECEYVYFIPSKKSGLTYGYLSKIEKVSKLKDYSKLNPLWNLEPGRKPSEEWDMLIEFNQTIKVLIEDMKSRNIDINAIQGGIKYQTI